MLSNKRSRIFVSFLTFMAFLSVLVISLQSVGVQAQGPEAASDASEVSTTEPGPNPDTDVFVYKSVISDGLHAGSTVIQTGDELTYRIRITNTTAVSIVGASFVDTIPEHQRFNWIEGLANSRDLENIDHISYTYDSANNQIIFTDGNGTDPNSITLVAGNFLLGRHGPDSINQYSVTYEVDTNNAKCGVPMKNTATVTANGKSYKVEREVVAFDQLISTYNMEDESTRSSRTITQTSLFTDVLNNGRTDRTEFGWQHSLTTGHSLVEGAPFSPTFLGATSGVNVWGTNLSGPYTDSAAYAVQMMTGTLDLRGIPHTDTPLYLVWQQYIHFLAAFGQAEVIIKPVDNSGDVTIYDSRTVQSSGVFDTQGWQMQSVDIQDFAGKEVHIVYKFSNPGNNVNINAQHDPSDDPHWGWYIDDVGLGACNMPALTLNKVAMVTPGSCNISSTSGEASKKEAKLGFSGLLVPANTEVYYCFAVQNTGNISLGNHTLVDNLLRDGEIITASTAGYFAGSGLAINIGAAHNGPGLLPTQVTNTFDLLNNTTITPTHVITQNTINTATWRAEYHQKDYYNVVATTNLNDKGFTSIASTGTRLELKDDSEITATLPFAFELYTETFAANTGIVIGNNGGILFANAISDVLATNTPLPLTRTQGADVAVGFSETGPDKGAAIFPFWDDLGTGDVYSDVQGTSPNRVFVVEWIVPNKGAGGTNTGQFQARLYETTNDIVFVYNDVNFGNTSYDNGASATIGISYLITETHQFSFNNADTNKTNRLQDGLEIRFSRGVSAVDSASVGTQDALTQLSMSISTDGTCTLGGMDSAKVAAGDNVTVCYYIVNNGSVTMTNVSLTDTRSGDLLTKAALSVDLGVYRNTNTLVYSQTFAPEDNIVLDSAATMLANNKYPFGSDTYNFQDVGFNGAAGQGSILTMDAQDNGEANVELPFDFTFYGVTSRNLRVGNNGGVLFNQTVGHVSPNNTKLPNNEHGLAMFPYWDTFEGEQGNVYYNTLGTAPNRMFVIQWDEIQHFEQSTDQGTFQMILYEGTDQIKYQYQDLDFGMHSPASNQTEDLNWGASATVGLNHNASDAHEFSFNNMRQTSNLSPTLNITNSTAVLFTPLTNGSTDQVTITVNYTPSIQLTKTVGTVEGACATTDEITVTAGTTVYYCYTVKNTGNTTFDSNTLKDDKLDLTVLFDANQLTLGPGEMTDTVSLGTSSLQAVITTDTMNTAVWTATSNPATRGTAVATDTAKVNIQLPPTAVEVGELGASRSTGLPLGSLVVGMLLLVAGGYVVHRRRMQ